MSELVLCKCKANVYQLIGWYGTHHQTLFQVTRSQLNNNVENKYNIANAITGEPKSRY